MTFSLTHDWNIRNLFKNCQNLTVELDRPKVGWTAGVRVISLESFNTRVKALEELEILPSFSAKFFIIFSPTEVS